ncbi:MAG TPA: FecR domain-containing protein [Chitinophagaceae bacterium]|jgi:ferric-dicitrate binding protein FerR (iron transport regulator)
MADSQQPGEENQSLPFSFRKKELTPGLQSKNWQAVEAAILVEEAPRRRTWIRPALVTTMLVLALVVLTWWLQNRPALQPLMAELKTHYGEIKRVTLPDGSLVVLNANSTMRLPQNWTNEGDRQVWLEGEAYFEVAKKPATHQKFVVHTTQVDVQVLGTRFNVNTRHLQSVVSLEEGKVQLLFNGKVKEVIEKKTGNNGIRLTPGETAIVNPVKGTVIDENKDVVYHSGWTRNEFHFDHTPLSEVAVMINDVYGYKMQYADSSLQYRSISGGDLSAGNIQELVSILEVALRLKLTIIDKTIVVAKIHK